MTLIAPQKVTKMTQMFRD